MIAAGRRPVPAQADPGRPLVLLPVAFAGDWIWKPAARRLRAAGHTVIAVRRPFAEFGSDAVTSIDMLAEAVWDVLVTRRVGPAIICGNSIGGQVALSLADRHPELVHGLVLSGVPGLVAGRTAGIGAPRTPTRAYARAAALRLFTDPTCVTAADVSRTLALADDRRTLRNVVRALRAARVFDAGALLGRVGAPTLLLWGADDRITPPGAWRQAARSMPAARFELIPDSGHVPMLEAPEAYVAAVQTFLAVGSTAGRRSDRLVAHSRG